MSFPTGGSFTPFVRADYTKLWMRSYRERGETAQAQLLAVNPDNAQSLIARAGVKWTLPLGEAVKLESHLAAGTELLDNQFGGHANLTGQPETGFAYRSEKTGRALSSTGLRINGKPTENLNLFAAYEAQLRKRYRSQQAQIGVEYRF
ncbi:autotransporter domain-containing protein [Neisseria sp.]|uniref:autotransporter outer membrane beta-barrel domain-containing protein n=1 Tax=Neisseria sp. TaxID=192066 RepID=UPI0035A03AEF